MCKRAAARVTLRSSISASKTRSRLRSSSLNCTSLTAPLSTHHLILHRTAPFQHADRSAIQSENKSMRNRAVSLNSPQRDDDYASRHYDASWRSVKAGALLAVLIVAIAFLV